MAAWPTRFEFDDLIALPWKLPIWEGIIWIQCGIGLVAAALAILFARTPRSNGLLVLLLVVLAADMVYALPYDVTCSMGVVIVRGGKVDETRLVAFADALLYEVKRAGKNSLRIAEAEDDWADDRRAAA